MTSGGLFVFNGMGHNLLGLFDDYTRKSRSHCYHTWLFSFSVFFFYFLFHPFSLELGKDIDNDGNDEMSQDFT